MAGEPGLPSGTEAAAHCATRLAADADGRSVGVEHQHGLNLAATLECPQKFDRVAVAAC